MGELIMFIYNILDAVGNTTKKNEKLAILTEYSNNDALKTILFQCYNPYRNYYIKKIPKVTTGVNKLDEHIPALVKLLDCLDKRLVTGTALTNTVKSFLEGFNAESQDVIIRVLKRIFARESVQRV